MRPPTTTTTALDGKAEAKFSLLTSVSHSLAFCLMAKKKGIRSERRGGEVREKYAQLVIFIQLEISQ